MKNFKSQARAIRRGHIKPEYNTMTGFIELYRRTATNKKHTIFISQIDVNHLTNNG